MLRRALLMNYLCYLPGELDHLIPMTSTSLQSHGNQEVVVCRISKGVEKVRSDTPALVLVLCSKWDPLGGCSGK